LARILIIDDSAEFHRMVQRILHREGYETISAMDGESGLSTAISEQPDLILLDYMMPGLNGIETFRAIRANENIAKIPVIMITAFASQFEAQYLAEMNSEMADFITKPISPRELVARIQTVLQARRIAGMQ
jgi:DNA-binding response OmpR family regulator